MERDSRGPKAVLACFSSELEFEVFAELESKGVLRLVGVLGWDFNFFRSTNYKKSWTLIPGSFLLEEALSAPLHEVAESSLTIDTLNDFKEYMTVFFSMMARSDTKGDQTYFQRETAFFFLVNYWLGFLEKNFIQLVYFSGTPHEIVDYVLFACCKVQGIPTVMWQDSHVLQGKMLAESWVGPWKPVVTTPEAYRPIENDVLPVELLNKFQGSYANAEPIYSIEARSILSRNMFARFLEFRIGSAQLFQVIRAFKDEWFQSMVKIKKTFEAKWLFLGIFGCVKFLSMFANRASVILEISLAKKFLNSHVEHELPPGSFVVFFLHYQPEMTVTPMGDVGGNQFLALSSLRRAMPKDWTLVVKEHPAQFVPSMSGYFTGRDKFFYKRILSLPNTVLLANRVSSFEVIDKSRAVATITGTAGWESVARHKSAIIFGNSWYMDAPGVKRIRSFQDLKNLFEADGSALAEKISDQELLAFLERKLKSFDHVMFHPEVSRIEGTEWNKEAFRLALSSRLRSVMTNLESTT